MTYYLSIPRRPIPRYHLSDLVALDFPALIMLSGDVAGSIAILVEPSLEVISTYYV